jgi:hypothetical protein
VWTQQQMSKGTSVIYKSMVVYCSLSGFSNIDVTHLQIFILHWVAIYGEGTILFMKKIVMLTYADSVLSLKILCFQWVWFLAKQFDYKINMINITSFQYTWKHILWCSECYLHRCTYMYVVPYRKHNSNKFHHALTEIYISKEI